MRVDSASLTQRSIDHIQEYTCLQHDYRWGTPRAGYSGGRDGSREQGIRVSGGGGGGGLFRTSRARILSHLHYFFVVPVQSAAPRRAALRLAGPGRNSASQGYTFQTGRSNSQLPTAEHRARAGGTRHTGTNVKLKNEQKPDPICTTTYRGVCVPCDVRYIQRHRNM